MEWKYPVTITVTNRRRFNTMGAIEAAASLWIWGCTSARRGDITHQHRKWIRLQKLVTCPTYEGRCFRALRELTYLILDQRLPALTLGGLKCKCENEKFPWTWLDKKGGTCTKGMEKDNIGQSKILAALATPTRLQDFGPRKFHSVVGHNLVRWLYADRCTKVPVKSPARAKVWDLSMEGTSDLERFERMPEGRQRRREWNLMRGRVDATGREYKPMC